MDRYEKTIGLKTILTSIIRRWYIFILIFIPIVGVSFIVTNFMITKTYISTVSVSRGAGTTITITMYSEMQSYIVDTTINETDKDKSGALVIASERLKNDDIYISADEIKAGLSFANFTNGESSFSFSFTSDRQQTTQKILQVVAESSIEKMRANSNYNTSKIVSPASAAVKNSKENTYFLIAVAAGFVGAFGVMFADEIISDEVYDKEDVEYLGCSGFEVNTKIKKKEA